MNLELEVRTPSDGQMWGYENPPGSGNFTGLVADLVENVADIGWANLFILPTRLPYMDFSRWHTLDSVSYTS